MTPDKLREKGNRWRELGQYDLANIYNQHAAAIEEIERLKGELADANECERGNFIRAEHNLKRAEQAERRAERLEAEHYEALLIQKKKMQEVIDYWQGIAESRADKGE